MSESECIFIQVHHAKVDYRKVTILKATLMIDFLQPGISGSFLGCPISIKQTINVRKNPNNSESMARGSKIVMAPG